MRGCWRSWMKSTRKPRRIWGLRGRGVRDPRKGTDCGGFLCGRCASTEILTAGGEFRRLSFFLLFFFRHVSLILQYLIPTRLLRGSLPSPSLLANYPPLQQVYGQLVAALRIGDLKTFDEELAKHEMDLTLRGTYLTVERSRFICLRNLCRKV